VTIPVSSTHHTIFRTPNNTPNPLCSLSKSTYLFCRRIFSQRSLFKKASTSDRGGRTTGTGTTTWRDET